MKEIPRLRFRLRQGFRLRPDIRHWDYGRTGKGKLDADFADCAVLARPTAEGGEDKKPKVY